MRPAQAAGSILLWAASLLLVVGPSVAAKSGLSDPVGDGDPDLEGVAWFVDDASGDLVLGAAVGSQPPDLLVRVVWMRGLPGSPEPDEWYVATVVGGNATVFAGHGGQSRELAATLNGTADAVSLSFARVDPAEGPCTVVAGEVGHRTADGFRRSDVAPDGLASLDSLWPAAGACPVQSLGSADEAAQDDKRSPGAGLLLLGVAVGLAMALRRRS